MAQKIWSPNRGDIIWINFSPQQGHEMCNFHPMLVLSPRPSDFFRSPNFVRV